MRGYQELHRKEDLTSWEFAESTPEDAALLERMQGKTQTGGGAADPSAIGHHGHTMLFQDFVSAVAEGRSPLVDGAEGRRSVEIILGIYQAAEARQTITLPLDGDPDLKARVDGVRSNQAD